jgi:hypothetical protein
MSRIDSWHRKISTCRHFQNDHHNTAQIQHCPISMTFHMWVDYDIPNWFLTSKHFYRSPFSKWPPQYAQIQHCSISTSWIDSRHRTISTGLHFQNGRHNTTKIQHCSISKVAFDLFFKPVVSGQFGRLHNRLIIIISCYICFLGVVTIF